MKPGLVPGVSHTISVRVDENLTVPAVSARFPGFGEMPQVFATAFMVGFAEATAMGAMTDYMEPNEASVGIDVQFDHTAATPIGMTVTATAEVTAVEGRVVSFHVVLRDDEEQIGQGTHRRAVIDRGRFDARLAAKAERAGRQG